MCKVDWPHNVDLGVGADFLGNLMQMLLQKLPQNSLENKCKALTAQMHNYYSKYPRITIKIRPPGPFHDPEGCHQSS